MNNTNSTLVIPGVIGPAKKKPVFTLVQASTTKTDKTPNKNPSVVAVSVNASKLTVINSGNVPLKTVNFSKSIIKEIGYDVEPEKFSLTVIENESN